MNNYDKKDNENIIDSDNMIFGRNPVLEALKVTDTIDCIYVNSSANSGSIAKITSIAKSKGIVIKNSTDQKLTQMTGTTSHQGVVANISCSKYYTVDEILNISKERNTDPFIIICDEIEDPHNLGAIIRTAEAAGADGIIIPKRRSASLNQTVYKTSAGAASILPVAKVSNLAMTIDLLKQQGVWIYGADMSGEDCSKTSLSGPIALVIGSEGFGIGRLIKEKCDFLIKLPMLGKINSLNASVAAGIFMYEIVKQRSK